MVFSHRVYAKAGGGGEEEDGLQLSPKGETGVCAREGAG